MSSRSGAVPICEKCQHRAAFGPSRFWKLRCRKMSSRCGAVPVCKSKPQGSHMPGPLFNVRTASFVASARNSARCKKYQKPRVFLKILSKTVGRRGGFEEKLHFSWQGQHIGNFDMFMLRGRSVHFVRGVAPLKF